MRWCCLLHIYKYVVHHMVWLIVSSHTHMHFYFSIVALTCLRSGEYQAALLHDSGSKGFEQEQRWSVMSHLNGVNLFFLSLKHVYTDHKHQKSQARARYCCICKGNTKETRKQIVLKAREQMHTHLTIIRNISSCTTVHTYKLNVYAYVDQCVMIKHLCEATFSKLTNVDHVIDGKL